MLTINKLLKGTRELLKVRGKKDLDWQPMKILDVLLQPMDKYDALVYVANVKGLTDTYKVVIMFTDIDVEKAPRGFKPDKKYMKVKAKNGVTYKVERPNADKSPVYIRCTCEFFYFYSAYYVKQSGGLYGGGLKKYVRKTKHIPPRNPIKVPNVCKHLKKCIMDMHKRGLFK